MLRAYVCTIKSKQIELLTKLFIMSTQTKAAPKKVEVKESLYKVMVLESNKRLKEDCNKLGYALKVLTTTEGIHSDIVKVCKLAKKDKDIYKEIADNCRKTKKGFYRPFYVMQHIYKGFKQK